ncbi:hypothetical protein TWF225_000856 [Orbilia oligospora]|uniref:Uncharacterized protein n=1 Tax=Orbilia oligospora TaxID=2813651 RepID=A0A7C8KA14_ORBOL|nr:hypothetical protein TWF225_000856 [Orbilia oligospora]KAF3168842.1 hypothetical protein TWF751_007601 [Orbilia oligospora]KAF3239154.1 hypothetical protein TWF128_011859 [Orbilia oligospora]KAF3246027.1 hypothetical protein TWF217_010012 [Orbilia oligospora]KAF3284406.1 hypothetical protein TWF132_009831 [Orbilia oligospora]
MDAIPEDREIKALKHSNPLLQDINNRLPGLLWDIQDGEKRLRPRVKVADYNHIIGRLESFQEFPQLLDPILAGCMENLTSAFSVYLSTEHERFEPASDAEERVAVNTLAALGQLLYVWMKVRGPKVVLRFLYNDPKWLEPMLGVFEQTSKLIGKTDKSANVLNDVVEETFEEVPGPRADDKSGLPWHLRYVTLMWVSHLLYTPFDLVTIGDEPAGKLPIPLVEVPALPEGTPEIARRVMNVACCNIHSPGKDREGAAAAIVRLVVRKDVYEHLLNWFVDWVANIVGLCVKGSLREDNKGVAYVYFLLGLLGALSGIFASGERSIVGQPDLLQKVYDNIIRELYIDESGLVAQNAMLRKTMCKLFRNISYLYLPLPGQLETQDGPPEEVEEMIDQLLRLLDDRDSLVRYAASKSLSLIALRLAAADRSQIFEAVIDLYDSDVLYPNRALTKLDPRKRHQKDLSQVSVHLWHGLTLTVATFLRFHAATVQMLPKVLDCIITALAFEQRKATFATGGNVRDAACYAAWSLARNYKTEEMLAGRPTPPHPEDVSLPQVLALELVNAACLDPIGNIRRGASAALQELVGRHPNMIKDGISLVQAVDYSAVALRSRASTEVASKAAVLGGACYWGGLIKGLVDDWRGIGLQDPVGRTISAKGIGELSKIGILDLNKRQEVWNITKDIINRYGSGASLDIEVRHGSWYALADIIFSLINALEKSNPGLLVEILSEMREKTGVFDIFDNVKPRDFVHPVLKPEMTCEAAAYLVTALSDAAKIMYAHGLPDLPVPLLRRYLCVIDSALERWEENVTTVAVYAAERFFLHMNDRYRTEIVRLWLGKSKARTRRILVVKALGAVFRFFRNDQEWPRLSGIQQDIIDGLLIVSRSPHIEMRVAAISAFADGIFPEGITNEHILQTIHRSLIDYSVDSRGDVGSWARIEAIRAVLSLHTLHPLDIHTPDTTSLNVFHKIIGLSAEKLDRVRLKACDAIWKLTTQEPQWGIIFNGITAESSFWVNWDEYFERTVKILSIQSVRESYLEGYATSAGAGSDSVMRSSTRAMQKYLSGLPPYPNSDGGVALSDIVQSWITIVEKGIAGSDDRVVVPALAMLGGWFESGLMEKLGDGEFRFQALFSLTQKAHFKSSNVAKLSGAVKIYNGLASVKSTRTSSIKKLVSMLLHPFPKIRTAVSETLYLIISLEGDQEEAEVLLMDANWADQPKELKATVEEIKGLLGI